MIVTSVLMAIAAAALQPAPAAAADEERLIRGAIRLIRAELVYPPEARFRRVHLRRGPGMDGRMHLNLCGQVYEDDPRTESDWQVFAATEINGRVMLLTGNRGVTSAASFCRGIAGEMDLSRDFSPRFQAAIAPAP